MSIRSRIYYETNCFATLADRVGFARLLTRIVRQSSPSKYKASTLQTKHMYPATQKHVTKQCFVTFFPMNTRIYLTYCSFIQKSSLVHILSETQEYST